MDAVFLRVEARVRYWEDTDINGTPDTEKGGRVPMRVGDAWCPRIDLERGSVVDWPPGLVAAVHCKVADRGEYWLQDDEGNDIAKWLSYYVPDAYLCHGDRGYGDYIILNVDGNGCIKDYRRPVFDAEQWEPVTR